MWSEHCSYKSSRVHLQDAADRRPAGAAGARRERRRRRHRRRAGRGLQDRIAQSSVVHRAVSGRGDRRRRHHPRHLHDGRAADRAAELAALRTARRAAARDAPARRRGRRHRRLRQQHRHPDRRRRDRVRAVVRRQPARQRASASASPRRPTSSRASPRASATPVYYVGAKTGRDGIHGATMASAEFDEKSAEKRPAVQVGDPFMEKLLLEACLEVMQTDALDRHPGHGRRRADLLDDRDGIARRRRRRDRRRRSCRSARPA